MEWWRALSALPTQQPLGAMKAQVMSPVQRDNISKNTGLVMCECVCVCACVKFTGCSETTECGFKTSGRWWPCLDCCLLNLRLQNALLTVSMSGNRKPNTERRL